MYREFQDSILNNCCTFKIFMALKRTDYNTQINIFLALKRADYNTNKKNIYIF